MALVGVELETLVSEPDALTTRPPRLKTLHFDTMLRCFSSILCLATLVKKY